MENTEEKICAMWLADAIGPGNALGKELFEKYGSFYEIYKLSEAGYKESGIAENSAVMQKLLNKDTDICKTNYDFCRYNFFEVIEYNSDNYPQCLKSIKNPPPVLYARGRMINFDENVCISVVGTRSYTDIGWNSTYKITSGLARCGAVVITGLASGIDTAATQAALEFSGFAVGVIGTGLERVYPSENQNLFNEMYSKGLIISELPPFSETSGKYFPVRNRLISGLSNGVLVGEGDIRSGAIITAQHAIEQGRKVFAIPGEIGSSESSGVNRLIQKGAIPVFEAWDVLKEFAYLYPYKLVNVYQAQNVDIPEKRSSKKIRVIEKRKRDAENKSPKTSEPVSSKSDRLKNGKPLEFQRVDLPEKLPLEVIQGLSELELKIYLYISGLEECIIDSIAGGINENSNEVAVAITTLELAGLITVEGTKAKKV